MSDLTVGVEEEYHPVDAQTWRLADAPEVMIEAHRVLGDVAGGESSTSQLEVASPVCTSLADVRAQLLRMRRGADASARAHGCRLLRAVSHRRPPGATSSSAPIRATSCCPSASD